MNAQDVARNVRLYRLYVTFEEPLLWGPILITSIIHLGHMSLSQIYYCEAVTLIGTIFLQVPTGALADIIGRKKTIVFGSILWALSIVWFALMRTPFDVWGANISWMIGMSLCTGADSAFLYDTLKEAGREAEYKRIDGEAAGNRLLIVAVCSLVVGWLAKISLRLPLLLSIPGVIFSLIVAMFFQEPSRCEKLSAKKQADMMKMGVLFVANHKAVKWIIGFTTLIGVTSKIWFFTYNPYFELVNLPLGFYGVIFFCLNIIAWYFSRYAENISRIFREEMLIVGMLVLLVLPILTMGFAVTALSVLLTFPQNVVRGFMRPFFGEFLNRHLNSENRATTLSVQQAVSGMAQFLAMGIFGMMLAKWGLASCLILLGFTVLVLGSWSILKYKKIFSF